MAKQVQFRRGTTAQLSSVTGVEGELFVDTTKDTLTVHDGYQAGGFPLLREDLNNLANGAVTPVMLANGTANQLLRTNAAGNGVEWFSQSLAGRLIACNAYYTSGATGSHTSRPTGASTHTWTKPAGCTYVLVYVTGGGGGARHNSNNYRGAGGGGGGTAIGWHDVSSVSTVAVTVGGGGAKVTSGRGAGGGTSSFGSFCSATGGQGGTSDGPHQGGIGGSASGGFMNIVGGDGEMAHSSDREGGGGSSFWHKSGSDHYSGNTATDAVRTQGYFGSGGGNGYYSQNSISTQYGNGGAGVVVVYSYSQE